MHDAQGHMPGDGPVPEAGEGRGRGRPRGRGRGQGKARGRGRGRGSRGGAGSAARQATGGPQSPPAGLGSPGGSAGHRRGVVLNKWRPMYEFLESLPREEGPLKRGRVREWLTRKWDELPEELRSMPEEKIVNYACNSHWRLIQQRQQLQQQQGVKEGVHGDEGESDAGAEDAADDDSPGGSGGAGAEDAADDDSAGGSGDARGGGAGRAEGTDGNCRPRRSNRPYNTRRRQHSAAMVEEVQPSRQAVQPHLHGPEPGYPRVLRQEGLMLQMERGEAVSSMLDVYNSLVLLHKRVSLSLPKAGGSTEGNDGQEDWLSRGAGQRKSGSAQDQKGAAQEGVKPGASSPHTATVPQIPARPGAAHFVWPPGSSCTAGATVPWQDGGELKGTAAASGEGGRGWPNQEAAQRREEALRGNDDAEMQERLADGEQSTKDKGDRLPQGSDALQGPTGGTEAGAGAALSQLNVQKEVGTMAGRRGKGEGLRQSRDDLEVAEAEEDGEGEVEEVNDIRETEEDEGMEEGEEGGEDGEEGEGAEEEVEEEGEDDEDDDEEVEEATEEEEEEDEGGADEEESEDGEEEDEGEAHERGVGGAAEAQEYEEDVVEVEEAEEEQDGDVGNLSIAGWSGEEGDEDKEYGAAHGMDLQKGPATAEHMLRTRSLPSAAEGISWPILFGGVPAELDALQPLSCLGQPAALPPVQLLPTPQPDASPRGGAELMEEAASGPVPGQPSGPALEQQQQQQQHPAPGGGMQDSLCDVQLSRDGARGVESKPPMQQAALAVGARVVADTQNGLSQRRGHMEQPLPSEAGTGSSSAHHHDLGGAPGSEAGGHRHGGEAHSSLVPSAAASPDMGAGPSRQGARNEIAPRDPDAVRETAVPLELPGTQAAAPTLVAGAEGPSRGMEALGPVGQRGAGAAGAGFVSWGPTMRAAPLGICIVPQPLPSTGAVMDAHVASTRLAARAGDVVAAEGATARGPTQEGPAGEIVTGVSGNGHDASVRSTGDCAPGILSVLGRRELGGAAESRSIPPWPVQSSGRSPSSWPGDELSEPFVSYQGPASGVKRKRGRSRATVQRLGQALGRSCRLPAGPACGRAWAPVKPSFLLGWAGLPGRHWGPVARLQRQQFMAQWNPSWALYTTHFAAAPVGHNAEQVVAQKVLDVRFRPWPAGGPGAWGLQDPDSDEGVEGDAGQRGAPGEAGPAGGPQAGSGADCPDLRGTEGAAPEASGHGAGPSLGAGTLTPGPAAGGRPRAMGPQLVCGCNEAPNELLAIDLRSGVPVELNGHSCQIQAVEYALQGDAIVSCAANLLKVWDASSGALRCTLGVPAAQAPLPRPEAAFGSRGRGRGRGRGRPRRGSSAADLGIAADEGLQDEAARQDGVATQPEAARPVVSAGPGGPAMAGQMVRGHEGKVLALAVNAGDSRLVASSSSAPDTQVLLWNVQQGQQVQRLGGAGRQGRVYQEDHTPPMDVLCFLGPDTLLGGSDQVGATGSSRLCVWDLDTGRRTVSMPALNSYITSLAPDPLSCTISSSDQSCLPQAAHGGARVVLCGAGDGSAGLFDLRQAQPVTGSLVAGGTGCETTTVGFSPCGTYLHASFNTNCALVWDRRILQCSRDTVGGTGRGCGSSHRGGGRPVHLLSHGPPVPGVLHSAQYPGYVDFGDEGVNYAKWFHGSPCLATASGNGTVALWDVTCGVPLMASFKGHARAINSLDIVADDSAMASAGDDQKVVLYQRRQLSGPSGGSRCPTATWRLTHSLV